MNKTTDKIRILVLCTGNSCRSQMAEGFFRRYGGEKIEVKSAGLKPKGVNPLAIKVMKEVGIDISAHSSNHLNEYLNEDFDYVITVCDNAAANCPVWPKKTNPPAPFPEVEGGRGVLQYAPTKNDRPVRLHWPFPDPA
ncbi:MAG: arsenate reductase ArsC, partial [Candidatus Zixiibacteriota bacterium]